MRLQTLTSTLGIAVLLGGTGAAQDHVERMDQIVKASVASGEFMGAVLVARDDDILLSKGYGFANLEWDIPNTPATKFRVGSVTKQFTAAAILLLEERRQLKIEDRVSTHLSNVPASWKDVTIQHLLTHTSGIPSFTDLPQYRSIKPQPTTPDALLALVQDKPLEFPPGTRSKYSNSGYVVLGMIVEQASGRSYADFIRDNIFAPLGMNDTAYDSNALVTRQRAAGYVHRANRFENAGYIDMTVPFAAGALHSTAEDLLRWEHGLFGGRLLSAQALREMTTPFLGLDALGLQVSTSHGRQAIEHTGNIDGFTAHVAYYPEDKLTVVVLGNVQSTAPMQLARRLAIVAHGGTVTLPAEKKEIRVGADLLDRYTGVYRLASGDAMIIERTGTQLSAQLAGSRRDAIFPESETAFFLKTLDIEIEFPATPPDAKASRLVVHQGGPDLEGTRVADAEARSISSAGGAQK